MTTIDVTQDRHTFIGGSDAATILGLNPYKSAYELWLEKTQRAEPKPADSIAAKHGAHSEPLILELYSALSGNKVFASSKYHDPEYPFLAGHPDAFVDPQRGRLHTIVECKTAGEPAFRQVEKFEDGFEQARWGEPGTDQIPDAYRVQCLHYLMLTGAEVCDVPVLIGGREMEIYRVERDESLIASLRSELVSWWETHVIADVEPDASTAEDIKLAFPASRMNDWQQADAELLDLVKDYKRAQSTTKRAKESEEALKLEIQKRIGEREGFMNGIKPLCTWKTQFASRIDVARLRQDHPQIAAEYSKESQSRVFRLGKGAEEL